MKVWVFLNGKTGPVDSQLCANAVSPSKVIGTAVQLTDLMDEVGITEEI